MPRICLVLIAGLDESLLTRSPKLPALQSFQHRTSYAPPFPAVTSTVQATLTTGASPAAHGIICNGLYTHSHPTLHPHLDLTSHADVSRQREKLTLEILHPHLDLTSHADARLNVSFWEQSNSLLLTPRFWQGMNKKIAMLFWQNSMPAPDGSHHAADIVLTPKPIHIPNAEGGKTLTACWSSPAGLYPTLTEKLGSFPLHNYWSPLAGLPSSDWILHAARHVWQYHTPDLQLVYLPHLDFNLMRLGPNHPALLKDLQDLDALLAPLAAQIRADGGTLIIAGDYGMSEVSTPLLPNLALRNANLLSTKSDPAGKLLVDYAASPAFAMVDHQIAHLYIKPGHESAVTQALAPLGQLISSAQLLPNPRSGAQILLASPSAWFAHDWWQSDDEKPQWQFSVDIHNKPGFDPRELFFDREKKCIAQNPALIKGSHGLAGDQAPKPVLLSDSVLPQSTSLTAEQISPWLARLLAS